MMNEERMGDWYSVEILIDLGLKGKCAGMVRRRNGVYRVEMKEVMECELCVHSKRTIYR